MFYLAIVNKVLHHCHSWLARQYIHTSDLFFVHLVHKLFAGRCNFRRNIKSWNCCVHTLYLDAYAHTARRCCSTVIGDTNTWSEGGIIYRGVPQHSLILLVPLSLLDSTSVSSESESLFDSASDLNRLLS